MGILMDGPNHVNANVTEKARTRVHRFLVTADLDHKMKMWVRTGAYANWLDGRDNGDRETWMVTCFDQQADQFLAAGRATGVTVEEISGGGDSESYTLLVGEPGSGWAS